MEKQIIFNNKVYRLNASTDYYIGRDKDMNPQMLHRDIWEYYSGKKIPKGYIIHHIDGDRKNNDFSNLTCLSPAEHSMVHRNGEAASKRLKEYPERVANFVQKAKEWHKTPEARQMTRDRFKGVKHSPRICKNCHQVFGTYKNHEYCNKCLRMFRARAIRRGFPRSEWMRFV